MTFACLQTGSDNAVGHRKTRGPEHGFGMLLIHGGGRSKNAGMRVGDAQQLQEALYTSIFAPTAVKSVKHCIRMGSG